MESLPTPLHLSAPRGLLEPLVLNCMYVCSDLELEGKLTVGLVKVLGYYKIETEQGK